MAWLQAVSRLDHVGGGLVYSPMMMEAGFDFLPLLIVLGLAFAVPILLARVRSVPVVVGEILAGVLVGGSVLGWVEEGVIVALMGDIGLAFLMFLAGMEIDFEQLFPRPASKAAGRGGEVIIPHGDSQMDVGDRVTLLGSLNKLGKAEEILKARVGF